VVCQVGDGLGGLVEAEAVLGDQAREPARVYAPGHVVAHRDGAVRARVVDEPGRVVEARGLGDGQSITLETVSVDGRVVSLAAGSELTLTLTFSNDHALLGKWTRSDDSGSLSGTRRKP
jgi:hypothetical protein